VKLIKSDRKLKKMTSECHRRGSRGNHRVKKEYAKANGIWRQMSDEEYERKKAEIEVCLEVLMEWLQKEEEDQRYGFLMRRKMRWHKLQKKREQLVNSQCKEEILKTNECLGSDLKAEASSEAKRSQCFKSDILCMFAGIIKEEGQFADIVIQKGKDKHNLNSILEEDETARSHVHAHA